MGLPIMISSGEGKAQTDTRKVIKMEKFNGTLAQKIEALLAIKAGEQLWFMVGEGTEDEASLQFSADINVRDGSICVIINKWNMRTERWTAVGYMEPQTAVNIYLH